ncbi:5-bromo-4-chloroindolyl phosphate hydrolysis family protein [Butyrivibrio sp. MC2013]|uniref:5-bromo-4-chloroindolyl phosphate hydrolysis family protein n=1 Tax=Butyrivibrio sp. MC2013 TaxID=1280686 RepID=UPI0004045ECC|nr:5-bromo-4-chloroindolyl phosphate hydrolysis family protein [Butyrivibrio sp. MC2013]
MSIGDEIIQGISQTADTVTKAVETGDFSHLSGDITRTVSIATDRVRAEARKISIDRMSPVNNAYRGGVNSTESYLKARREAEEKGKHMSAFQLRRPGKGGAIAGIIVGGILTFSFGIAFLGVLGAFVMTGLAETLIGLAVVSAFLGVSMIPLISGITKSGDVDRFRKLASAVGSREYIGIDELCQRMASSRKDVLKDIKRLMKKGMLPEARLDEGETTLILTRSASEQYDMMQRAAIERREEQQLKTVDAEVLTDDEAARALISEGNSYLVRVRQINDKISEADTMSDKLYKLEKIMQKIFEEVGRNPSKANDLRKFMNYYLPTTEKLLTAYVQLDGQPGVGNVVETRQQISGAMDTINMAFEKLLDDLFQEQAWDISSDISVMQTMMKQDGLVKDDMPSQMSGTAAATATATMAAGAYEKE